MYEIEETHGVKREGKRADMMKNKYIIYGMSSNTGGTGEKILILHANTS